MIAKTLLIGFIAFDGAAIAPASAFTGGSVGVAGCRNISGWKQQPGLYQIRIGGPVLTALNLPAQVNNEWSRAFGNSRVLVTLLSPAGAPVPANYELNLIDANTYSLATTTAGGAAADFLVQFSVETLANF